MRNKIKSRSGYKTLEDVLKKNAAVKNRGRRRSETRGPWSANNGRGAASSIKPSSVNENAEVSETENASALSENAARGSSASFYTKYNHEIIGHSVVIDPHGMLEDEKTKAIWLEQLERPITIGMGGSRDEKFWRNENTTFQGFLSLCSEFEEGPKDGPCLLQGETFGEKRSSKEIKTNYLAIYDIETGESLEDIAERLIKKQLTFQMWPTHSNGSKETTVAENAIVKWAKKNGTPLADLTIEHLKTYLRNEKSYHPDFVKTATGFQKKHVEGKGVCFVIKHAPMPRGRICFPLDEPSDFIVPESTQQEQIARWKDEYVTTGEGPLELTIDTSCQDPARLHYPPRLSKHRGEQIWTVIGRTLKLVSKQEWEDASKTDYERNMETIAGARKSGSAEQPKSDFKTKNILKFAASDYSNTFMPCEMIRQLAPDEIRNEYDENKVEARCSRADEHTGGDVEEDRAFVVWDALPHMEQAWSMHCQHQGCIQHFHNDRLRYLDEWCQAHGIEDAMELVEFCDDVELTDPEVIKDMGTGKDELDKCISQLTNQTPGIDINKAFKLAVQCAQGAELSEYREKIRGKVGMSRDDAKSCIRDAKHAEKMRQKKARNDNNRTGYTPVELKKLENLNKKYALCVMGMDTLIAVFSDEPDGKITFLKKSAFQDLNMGKTVFRIGDDSPRELTKEWLAWEDRKTYSSIVFDPSAEQKTKGALNLWRGFAVKPIEGDWSLLRAHMFEVLCRFNPYWFAWLLSWLANIIQKPSDKPGTAVVFRGEEEGVGKSIAAALFSKLMPNNSVTVSNQKHVTGNFNAHQAQALFMNCEEAFFAGNKADKSAFKEMITGETRLLEKKGFDPITIPNHTRYWLASNEEWVVSAGGGSRRFFVMDVPSTYHRNFPYFEKIISQMEKAGGLEAMMYDLLHLQKPTKVNLRDVPKTPYLAEQVEQSFDKVHKWIAHVIEEGQIAWKNEAGDLEERPLPPTAQYSSDVSERAGIPASEFLKAYKHFARNEKYGSDTINSQEALAKRVKSFGISLTRPGKRDVDRTRMFKIPPLDEVQKNFEDATGTTRIGTDDVRNMDADKLTDAEQKAWRAYGLGDGPLPGRGEEPE